MHHTLYIMLTFAHSQTSTSSRVEGTVEFVSTMDAYTELYKDATIGSERPIHLLIVQPAMETEGKQ